jgi:hypothetical protein
MDIPKMTEFEEEHFTAISFLSYLHLYISITLSDEILGWEGVGNRQLFCFFKA